ncbi:hypothetical protein NDU88_008132 [Pleurodeles waltl]|uniref:Uncharacterized protein n=1 Tax=Pleurodeles waltl TaxID=8319 RepID=A0AAV7QPW2_PLEWA|nr:hypothetical protein NDU88_008132 [Pleurodeles waltl]
MPPGPHSICLGQVQRNQGHARSTGPRGQKCLSVLGPTRAQSIRQAPQALPFRGSARTKPPRATHPALNAARVSTRCRSAEQEEGPQASARAGQSDAVKSPHRDRGQGLAAPLVRPACRARTPVRDGPGWRTY